MPFEIFFWEFLHKCIFIVFKLYSAVTTTLYSSILHSIWQNLDQLFLLSFRSFHFIYFFRLANFMFGLSARYLWTTDLNFCEYVDNEKSRSLMKSSRAVRPVIIMLVSRVSEIVSVSIVKADPPSRLQWI